jgi:uncharacterized membrane protein YkvA (DUF1232 family)
MPDNETTLADLQKLVDGFPMDVGRVRAALADNGTPPEARALLVGGLNYVLDSWDMFPDHYPGIGVVDDALVLRAVAHLAVAQGAAHRGLAQLAGEIASVRALLGGLSDRFERLCGGLRDRVVRGRTAAAVLAVAETRALFEADMNRLAKRHQPAKLAPGPGGIDALVNELRKMVGSALAKAGVSG